MIIATRTHHAAWMAWALMSVGACREPDVAGDDAGLDGAQAALDAGTHTPDGNVEPCTTGGLGGHLQLVSAYWASSDAYGDHLAELAPAIPTGHVDLPRLAKPLPDGVDVIVDLHWQLFDFSRRTVRPDLDVRLDQIAETVGPLLSRIRAFYLVDEPYLAGHWIPRGQLEVAINAVKARFPSVPSYITFGHHCFDPGFAGSECALPSVDRGIPRRLDWVGFDWYNNSNDLSEAGGHVASRVESGVARIKQLAPDARVVIVPEAYTDSNRLETTVVATLHDYFVLAQANRHVFGVDLFLWADVPGQSFLGSRSLPSVRAAVRGFGRAAQAACGRPTNRLAVTQWYSPEGPDYRYEGGIWDGRSHGYQVHGVAFSLPPAGTPGTVPLYHCLVDRPASVDSYLTTNSGCDGASTVAGSRVIGGIYLAQQPGTVPLQSFALMSPPWDHAYTLSLTPPLVGGYQHKFPIGWVYPPGVL